MRAKSRLVHAATTFDARTFMKCDKLNDIQTAEVAPIAAEKPVKDLRAACAGFEA